MTYRITIHWRGKSFEADSKEGLAAVLDELEKREGLAPAARAAVLLSRSIEEQLHKVLRVVARNDNGLESDEICKVASVRGGQGLGSASKGWKRVLRSHGFELEDVLRRVRDGERRLWLPGPRLDDALKSLEQNR